MFTFIIKFFIVVLFCACLACLYARYNRIEAHPIGSIQQTHGSKKCRTILLLLSLSLYLFLAFVLSLSWLGGDDFFFPHPYNATLKEHLLHVAWKYCNWVSRFGEIIPGLTGISEIRWQHFLITPLFIVALPFALYRLIKRSGESICSPQGIAFYILTLSLLLIQPDGGSCWRNFRCYTASTNYLWPILGICYFLSFYRADQVFDPKRWRWTVPAMFALGLYAGWSIDCVTCILVPCCVGICVVKFIKKKCLLPQFAGCLGSICGAFMLFGSPAHSRRALAASESLSINVADMPFGEAFDLACSITSENVHILSAGAIQAYFGDFPVILRALFIPELMAEFLTCCGLALIVCAILAVFSLLTSPRTERKRILLIVASGLTLAFMSASAYIMSGIPGRMSFLPPIFTIIACSGFLVLRLPWKACLPLALSLLIYLLHITIPAAAEAYSYLPARAAHYQRIHQKIQAGERTLELPYPFETTPKDRLNLIKPSLFCDTFKGYPNTMACAYYDVDNIRTLPRSESSPKQGDGAPTNQE